MSRSRKYPPDAKRKTLHLYPEDYELLQTSADESGRTLSEQLHIFLQERHQSSPPAPPKESTSHITEHLTNDKDLDLLEHFEHLASLLVRVHSMEDFTQLLKDFVEPYKSVDSCGFYLLDPLTQELKLHYAKDFTEEEQQEAEATAMERHPGMVLRTGKGFHIPDTAKDTQTQTSTRSSSVRSRLYMPLKWREQTIGVFGFANSTPNSFTQRHERLLSFICHLTSLSYENFLLLERLEQERQVLEERVKRRTASLLAAKEEVENISRLKDEFLSTMSHELRTPLHAILGYSEVLQDGLYGELTAKQHKTMKTIHDSGTQLLNLINGILDLGRMDAGPIHLDLQSVHLGDLASEVYDLMKDDAEKKQLTFHYKSEDTTSLLHADANRVRQIIANLVSNAIKFTPSGGDIGINVHMRGEENVCIEVWDTGCGIPEEKFQTLFQPFVQLDGSFSRVHGGTGLGLALVSKLVEAHGGEIHIESEVDQGTRFTVAFPAIPHRAFAVDPMMRFGGYTSLERPKRERFHPGSIRLLLVDDHIENIEPLKDHLLQQGFLAQFTTSGEEAIKLIEQNPPHILLLDIQMPKMDGIDLIRYLRANKQHASIHIIAVTAYESEFDRQRCLNAGADDYITKPYQIHKIMTLIHNAIGASPHMTQR